jgi:hypothetical protein
MSAIAPGERQTGKQLWDALVQDGAIITARLVAECAGKPTFADACWASDDQAVMVGNPVTRNELHEQRTVQAAITAVIDIFRRRLVAEFGEAQARGQLAIVAETPLAIEQQRQPFLVGQALGFSIAGQFAERARHAGKPHGVQPFEGWMW